MTRRKNDEQERREKRRSHEDVLVPSYLDQKDFC